MADQFDIRNQYLNDNEREIEKALRPLRFSDFSGQKKIVEKYENEQNQK